MKVLMNKITTSSVEITCNNNGAYLLYQGNGSRTEIMEELRLILKTIGNNPLYTIEQACSLTEKIISDYTSLATIAR